MAIVLHAISARHLGGGLLISAAVAAAVAVVGHDLLPAEVPKKVRHRSPGTGLLTVLAIGAAGFGIYAIFLLLSVGSERFSDTRYLYLSVGAATTALSWMLVH